MSASAVAFNQPLPDDARRPLRIIAINRFYRPDHAATSQLLGDLAEHLAREGHDVTVLASRLLYDGGELLAKRVRINGVDVRRLATTRFGRANLIGRAFDYLTFYVSAFWVLLLVGRRGDLLIIKTDPPMLCIPAGLAARFRRMKTVNWCQDLFPEIAGALGMRWAGGSIGRLLRAARNRALRRAAFNAVLHETMAQRLLDMNIPAERIRVLPNWADAAIHPVAHQDNPLRRAWGFDDRTIVVGYSGNLGRAHLPDAVIELVTRTADIPGLAWLFIGGGKGLARVKAAVGDAPNVVFKPYQPLSQLSYSLSAADIHLITLDPKCEGYIVPSKYAGVRAVHRPVLFLGASDGAVACEIAREKAGAVLSLSAPETWRSQLALCAGIGSARQRDGLERWFHAISAVPAAATGKRVRAAALGRA